ncbi:hypothetical protein AB0A63_11250 [Lentzea sp. NPDC042327]|uniref:hypothetical protein n=1 Tax=Lentzea sp. NPDC042327 TaxID=3154801 RepID=UPI003409A1EC
MNLRSKRRPQDTITVFWSDWHARRADSGVPVNDIAHAAQSNRTSIYDLGKRGKLFPDPEFVTKLCTALGMNDAEQREWLTRYRALSAVSTNQPERRNWTTWHLGAVGAVAVVLGAAATVLVLAVTESRDHTTAPAAAAAAAVIEVQNKTVAGENELAEDVTPAYLSSRTVRRCAAPENACKLAGTEMSSGALVVAVCRATGDELVNYNRDSPYPDNPHRAVSNGWYRVVWPDKREGYLSEVYVHPAHRGGRGLRDC